MIYMHSQCAKLLYGNAHKAPDNICVHDACPEHFVVYSLMPYEVFKHRYVQAAKGNSFVDHRLRDFSDRHRATYLLYLARFQNENKQAVQEAERAALKKYVEPYNADFAADRAREIMLANASATLVNAIDDLIKARIAGYKG